jgi:hypothetical protein
LFLEDDDDDDDDDGAPYSIDHWTIVRGAREDCKASFMFCGGQEQWGSVPFLSYVHMYESGFFSLFF